MHNIALASWLLLVAGTASLAGCTSCQPLLDVRHCLAGQASCTPAGGDVVVAWNATWAARWPDVDGLLRDVPPGEHRHSSWTAQEADAFWTDHGIAPGSARKQLFVTLPQDVADSAGPTSAGFARVRVLEC